MLVAAVVGVPQGDRPAPPSAVSSGASREYAAGARHRTGSLKEPTPAGWRGSRAGRMEKSVARPLAASQSSSRPFRFA